MKNFKKILVGLIVVALVIIALPTDTTSVQPTNSTGVTIVKPMTDPPGA